MVMAMDVVETIWNRYNGRGAYNKNTTNHQKWGSSDEKDGNKKKGDNKCYRSGMKAIGPILIVRQNILSISIKNH